MCLAAVCLGADENTPVETSDHPLRSIMSVPSMTHQSQKLLETGVFGSSVIQCDLELMKTHLLEASDHPPSIMSLASMPSLSPQISIEKSLFGSCVAESPELLETNLLEASDHPLRSFMSLESVTS